MSLTPEAWDDRRDIVDVGMSDEYSLYYHTHPFPQFTSPDEPAPILIVPQPGAMR